MSSYPFWPGWFSSKNVFWVFVCVCVWGGCFCCLGFCWFVVWVIVFVFCFWDRSWNAAQSVFTVHPDCFILLSVSITLINSFVCSGVCVMTGARAHVWRSEGNLHLLSFTHVGPSNQAHACLQALLSDEPSYHPFHQRLRCRAGRSVVYSDFFQMYPQPSFCRARGCLQTSDHPSNPETVCWENLSLAVVWLLRPSTHL